MADRDPSFEFWKLMVKEDRFQAAGVENFLHVAGSLEFGQNVKAGVIVECAYLLNESPRLICYWVAEIVAVFGYIVRLRFFGQEDPALDLYRNAGYTSLPQKNQLDRIIHPIGWSMRNNESFRPPPGIDLPANLRERLEGRPTLPDHFHEMVEIDNKSSFSPGMMVEVTNRANVILAQVVRVIGRRIQFRLLHPRRYVWFHEFSCMFFPPGFGRHLQPPNAELEDEAPVDFFRPFPVPDHFVQLLQIHRFEVGAKLELIDPFNPQFITVGTVFRILRDHYLEIEVDFYTADDGNDRIFVHAYSDILLPAGFALEHGLMEFFRPPHEDFDFQNANIVPRELLQRIIPQGKLRANDLVEVVRSSGTNLINVGRIERISGHLVQIRFEDNDARNAHFYPISSEDLYPPGWCNSVGHRLIMPAR